MEFPAKGVYKKRADTDCLTMSITIFTEITLEELSVTSICVTINLFNVSTKSFVRYRSFGNTNTKVKRNNSVELSILCIIYYEYWDLY